MICYEQEADYIEQITRIWTNLAGSDKVMIVNQEKICLANTDWINLENGMVIKDYYAEVAERMNLKNETIEEQQDAKE